MKKVFSLLITLAMLISTVVVPMSVSADVTAWDGTTLDTEWAGEGTEASPYLITSAAELAGLASNVNGGTDYAKTYFEITNDIDLTNTANADWIPIGTRGIDDTGMCAFNGIIDGAGHVISNVKMTSPKNAMGLFGAIGSNGKVSKLGVNGVDIQFANVGDASSRCYQAGGFVACLAGTVEKCYAKNVTIKNTNNATSESGMI